MQLAFADNPEAQAACFPVMRQLRGHLSDEAVFVAQVARQAEQAYRLAYLSDDRGVQAVAGFRIYENLIHGRVLYVDDLVSDEAARSKGYGKALIEFLGQHAREQNCQSLQLDSGVQRQEAHAFYFRENMRISSYHFIKRLS